MFKIQVKIAQPDGTYAWKDLRPTLSELPYEWTTHDEAENMRRVCYGSDHSISRVVPK